MQIAIVVFEGFDELDAIGPYEVFQNAAARGADLDVGLYSLQPRDLVTAGHGLRIEPDGTLPDEPDVIVVPGGGWSDHSERGVRAEVDRGELPEVLERAHEAGSTIATVCTGAMIAASAGVLDGRPAVTHRSAIEDLRGTDARVVEARVVDDGDVLTAGGVTSGIDLALHLVARAFGADLAESIGRTLEYEPRGDVYGQ